jgi:hypothetical protein
MQTRLWNLYKASYSANNPIRELDSDSEDSTTTNPELPFTFRSRLPPKGTSMITKAKQDRKNFTVPDYKPRTMLKKYHRTIYSPLHNSIEMDIMFTNRSRYLIFVNENSRYLYAVKLKNKEFKTIRNALLKFFLDRATDLQHWDQFDEDSVDDEESEQSNIRAVKIHLVADGESAWNNPRMKSWLESYGVTYDFNNSPFLHHVPIIDSAIHTIRNAFGLNVNLMNNDANMQQVIDYMNNSVNRDTKLTPLEMEIYPELMESWIRHCVGLDHEAKAKQSSEGFFKYSPGNILMVHLDLGKTPKGFQKVR